jgi:FlaA1/EpsC-like NDP-sugar epimerase
MLESFFKKQASQKSAPFMKEAFLNKYQNEPILITGAGGSIGRKLVEILVRMNFKKMILLDQSEFNLFKLKQYDFSRDIQFEIADIRDRRKMEYVMQMHTPKLVIHTAAYKHVSLLQKDVYELIRVNVEGTINLFKSSLKNGVSDFIFVSTDKAVNPVNKMGLSKMLAELFLKSYIFSTKIQVKIVRFGNVINSSGSVIPTFLENIDRGKDMEVRNKNVARYFIYDDVVAKNILHIAIENTNATYLLEMNTPVNILDLANYLKKIKKANSAIKIVDLQEEEKLTEELLNFDEHLEKTPYENCYYVRNGLLPNKKLRKAIMKLVKNNKKWDSPRVTKQLQKCTSFTAFNFIEKYFILSSCLHIDD